MGSAQSKSKESRTASPSSTRYGKSKNGRKSAASDSGNPTTTPRTFHQFSELGDDIALEILSYVSEAPFEVNDSVQSPMTHVLPFVNRQFNEMCKSDTLWIASLQRLTYRNPDLCKNVFKQLLQAGKTHPKWSIFYRENIDKDDFMLAHKVHNMDYFDKKEIDRLVSDVYHAVSYNKNHKNMARPDNQTQRSQPSAKSMYFTVLQDIAYTTLPVFHARCPTLQKGMLMNLILFEPRYRMLIQEAMEGRKPHEFRGRQLNEPRPRFVFAHTRSLEHGSCAFLVEIMKCRMLEGGRFRIVIHFIQKVKLEHVAVRPGVHNGLHDARIKRFPTNP